MSDRRVVWLVMLSVLLGAVLASGVCLLTIEFMDRNQPAHQVILAPEEKLRERERISPENQVITAHHEAAHAVVDMAVLPERGVNELVVFSRASYPDKFWGLTYPGDGMMRGDEAYQHRALALTQLAGAAAEDVLFHKTPPDSDPDSDNFAFESLAYCEVAECECPTESRVGDRCLMNGELKPERERFYAETKRCVMANKEAIMDLAKLVILKDEDRYGFKRSLSATELKAFFDAHPLDTDACAEVNSSPAPPQDPTIP